MKIALQAQAFEALLADCLSDTRGTMETLKHVHLHAADGRLTATSSDLSQWLERSIEADVLEPGVAAVHAGVLSAGLSGAAGDAVLSVEAGKAQLAVNKRSRYKLPSIDPGDYPTPPASDWIDLQADAATVDAALQTVGYAAAKQDVRYYLNGVLLVVGGYAVATDGHRMAVRELYGDGPEDSAQLLIPRDSMRLLSRALNAPGARIRRTAARLSVVGEAMAYETALIDGRFPDWRRIAQRSEPVAELELETAPALHALKRITALQNTLRQPGSIRLTLSPGQDDGGLRIEPEDGSEEFVPGQASGEIAIGVMTKYLLEALSMCGDRAHIDFAGPETPMTVTPAGSNDRHIIMPVRI